MQEKIKLITVEGASFSGKTSLIAQLAQYGYKFIGEYADYANNGLDFPKLPFDTPEEAKSSIDFFLEIEKRRTADAKKLAKNSNLPIIMDRSPFSCMVF